MRLRTLITGAVLALSLLVATSAGAASFTTPVKLVGTNSSGQPDPTVGPFGGEPSIAVDPLGHVYIESPEGIPSAVGNSGNPGAGFWSSSNDGDTFASGRYLGSSIGGGDGDVIVANLPGQANSVFLADLEAAATQVCLSTNFGKTFTGVGPVPDPANCSTVNGGQGGPSDDRPWLTYDPSGNYLYISWHEFVSAQPLIQRSNDGGGDLFTAGPCGSIITNPAIEANVPQDVTSGTLVARPVVDKAGNLYILFATPTQQENVEANANGSPSGDFSQLYLAVSKNHCQSFTDYTVFDGAGTFGDNKVQFGDIFNNLAIDGAGNLYVIGAGFVNTPSNTTSIWLLKSTDGGQTCSRPARLDSANASKSAYMLPAAVGGPLAGELAVGYFRTINGITDPNSLSGKWTYSTAESTNANSASPTFSYSDVNPSFVYHQGQICNAGILCGLPGEPSDRSLLDFTSVALDPNSGCPLYTFAGNPPSDPTEKASSSVLTWNYVTRQTSDCLPLTAKSSGTPTKHKKHKKSKKKHKKPRAKHISRPPKNGSPARGFTG